MRYLIALAAPLALCAPAIAQDEAILEQGRSLTQSFIEGDIDTLWEQMTPDMQGVFGTSDELASFRAVVLDTYGEEATITEETGFEEAGFRIYRRTADWTEAAIGLVTQWAFDESGAIGGFFIEEAREAAPSAHLEYETQADLRLPFNGQWYVFWGGRDIGDNYHAVDPTQRFAADFVIADETGVSHDGDPAVLESYYCWGAEILAPADGYVVAAVDDLPDQPIGQTDAENPAGNHVILNLADNEYAFLAHFQQGSVRVQQGDEVAAGDVLGLCGNSGMTSEPHLHFHLQTTADLFDGDGLPAQFQSYLADGEPVERGEPLRGQIVEAQ